VWDITELFDLFRGPGKLEAGLAARPCLLNGIEVDLELLELDADVSVFGVELSVAVYLPSESPIVVSNEGIVEQCEIDGGAHHEKTEPRWDCQGWLDLALLTVLVVRLGVQVDDVCVGAGAVHVGETQYGTVIVGFDPLCWAGKPIAARDVEVGNASIIDCVPVWGPFEGLFVL